MIGGNYLFAYWYFLNVLQWMWVVFFFNCILLSYTVSINIKNTLLLLLHKYKRLETTKKCLKPCKYLTFSIDWAKIQQPLVSGQDFHWNWFKAKYFQQPASDGTFLNILPSGPRIALWLLELQEKEPVGPKIWEVKQFLITKQEGTS